MSIRSPFPPAAVARAPSPHGGALSGVLVARDTGYLAVCLRFHGDPAPGIKVAFFEDDKGKKGAAIGAQTSTDAGGVARLDRVVPAGMYVCEIEHQGIAKIPTVHSLREAYPVVLPLGRPYADLQEPRGQEHDSWFAKILRGPAKEKEPPQKPPPKKGGDASPGDTGFEYSAAYTARKFELAGKYAARGCLSRSTEEQEAGHDVEYGAAVFTHPKYPDIYFVSTFVRGISRREAAGRTRVPPSTIGATIPNDGVVRAIAHNHLDERADFLSDDGDRRLGKLLYEATAGGPKYVDILGATAKFDGLFLAVPRYGVAFFPWPERASGMPDILGR